MDFLPCDTVTDENFLSLNEDIAPAAFDFDTTDFSSFFNTEASAADIWDFKEESGLSLSDIEFRLYRLVSRGKGMMKFLQVPESVLENSKFKFDYNWPHLPQEPRLPSRLFRIFHIFALKIILTPASKPDIFFDLAKQQIIDLTRPIYDSEKQIYRSFLSLGIKHHVVVGKTKINLLIDLAPKEMFNHPDSEGILPLTEAIQQNQLLIVKKLIEKGADVNKRINEASKTPFMIAIELARLGIVEFLLDGRLVDPNIILPDGTSVLGLMAAHLPNHRFNHYFRKLVAHGHNSLNNEVFEVILLQFYASGNIIYKELVSQIMKGHLPLYSSIIGLAYSAVYAGDLGLMEFLHSLNVSLNVARPPGMLLVHTAASLGHERIVSFIAETGVNINCINSEGLTAIQLAFNANHSAIVCYLIKIGASDGLSDIIQRAISSDKRQIISAFLEKEDLDLSLFIFENRYNPVTWAIDEDRPQILEMMLESGRLNMHTPDLEGRTVFNINLYSPVSEEVKRILRQFTAREVFGSSLEQKDDQ